MPFDAPEAEDFSDEQLEAELAEAQQKLEDGTLGEDAEAAEAPKISFKQRLHELPPAKESTWAEVWHVPALFLGLGLFAIGLHRVWPTPQEDQFHAVLDQAEQFLEARDLEQAVEKLNQVGVGLERAPDDVVGRYHEVNGDQLYLALKDTGQPLTPIGRQNRKTILDQYDEAEEAYEKFLADNPDAEDHTRLDDQSLHFKARVLVARGEREKALAMLDELDEAEPRRRYGLVRSLIEQQLDDPSVNDEAEVLRLLRLFQDEVAAEKERDRERFLEQMVWLYRTEAQIRIAAKETDRAIDELMIGIQRLRAWDADEAKEAPLLTDIGKIHLSTGDYQQAETNLENAQRRLPSGHGLNAEILVALGDINLSKPGGGVDAAQGLYQQVVVNYKGEDAYIDGLVGLADTQARNPDNPQQWELSLDHFGQAIELLHERMGPPGEAWGEHHQNAADRIQTHAEFLLTGEQHERALAYLSLLRRLYGQDNTPVDLLLWTAEAHHALAEALKVLAEALDPKNPEPGLLASDVVEQQGIRRREAAVHYEDAAVNFVAYARRVSSADDAAHGSGLWRAAVSYDEAQLPQKAVDTYAEFVSTRQSDPKVAEAKNRLGRAYMALGDYQAAIDQFKDITEQFPQSTWAVDGLIPQARSYARLDQLDQAERLLKSVLTDHPSVGPDSEEYKEALIALGTLYYARGKTTPGDYEEAINYLTQAQTRYGSTEEGPRLRFLLADSYRQSVDQLKEDMQTRQSQSDRLAYQAQIQSRLQSASALFREVRGELENLPVEMLDDLQAMYLRNAYFYEADAIYDLGDYEAAIGLYANAASRWQEHPAALVAMVQIVNAHCEMGQYDRARVANRNAEELLSRLPDEVFEDGSMPMSREHWADWLRWTGELEFLGAAQGS